MIFAQWLIKIAVSLNMYALNGYACDLVNKQIPANEPNGCYDWCSAHSMYQQTDGNIHDVDGRITFHAEKDYYRRAYTGLSDDFSHDLQNACAVVMSGGEY